MTLTSLEGVLQTRDLFEVNFTCTFNMILKNHQSNPLLVIILKKWFKMKFVIMMIKLAVSLY